MRRQLRVCLTLLAVALAVAIAIHPQTAAAAPADNGLTAIQKRYVETAHVVNDVVQGAGTFNIGIGVDGTVTAKRLSGAAPQTVNYPAVGPYWSVRWRDSAGGCCTVLGENKHAGHPYVCVHAMDVDVERNHPVVAATQDYDQYDFLIEYTNLGDCPGTALYERMSVATGAQRNTCSHTYLVTEVINGVTTVKRMIKYLDDLEWANCFGNFEYNAFNTSGAIGTGTGLLWHRGDGAPSLFSYSTGNSPYIWPTDYDRRTLAYYNGFGGWLALVGCLVGWFCLRRHRRRNPV